MKRYFANLFRPWKMITFLMGTGFFVWGAPHYGLPTWDIPVSIIMSVLCYLLSPWAVSGAVAGLRTRDKMWGIKLVGYLAAIYFIGSGSYEIYNTIRMGFHPVTYWENLFFSIPITIIAGLIWNYNGTFMGLVHEISRAAGGKTPNTKQPWVDETQSM